MSRSARARARPVPALCRVDIGQMRAEVEQHGGCPNRGDGASPDAKIHEGAVDQPDHPSDLAQQFCGVRIDVCEADARNIGQQADPMGHVGRTTYRGHEVAVAGGTHTREREFFDAPGQQRQRCILKREVLRTPRRRWRFSTHRWYRQPPARESFGRVRLVRAAALRPGHTSADINRAASS